MNETVIAVADDDLHIRELVAAYLEKENYRTIALASAEEAWELLKTTTPDMWILDIMLPGMDGYEFCMRIRAEAEVPIILISARDSEVDKVLGLNVGGDDYMVKPFSPRELVARLTSKEFGLMRTLIEHPNRPFSRQELLKGRRNMRLFNQINLAFGTLLVVVLTIMGITFHYVLRDNLVSAQAKNMGQLGITLTQTPTLTVANSALPASTTVVAVPSTTVASVVNGGATNSNTTTRTTPNARDGQATPIFSTAPNASLVTTRNITNGTITLKMPLHIIYSIEHSLLIPLVIVLCVGGAVAFLLSLIVTRKLVRPLTQLRNELRKVENQKFSQVQLIHAGGEIGEVAQTIFEMAKKLDAYHRAQREFTQNASHELKTPLMSISGYAEGIRDEVFQGDKVKKGLDVIIQESNRLGKIVAEMTLLAKLDSEDGIFQWSSVNVKDIVSETIERIYPLLTKRGLSVRTTFTEDADQQLVIHADRDKLLQALINVVGNSVKYAKRQIQIKVSLIRNDIEISITDDGDGIPETLLPHVFHRFVRGKDGETGLGLAISRAIVERCGGVITAQNLDTGGANVMMRFPVSA